MSAPTVLFDGCCDFCSNSVRFIIKRDPGRRFRFASIHSAPGRELLRRCGVDPEKVQSLVLVDDGRCLHKSDAALAIAGQLEGIWKYSSVLRALSPSLRDKVYDLVARQRHILSRREGCLLPSPEDRERFLQ